jgi:hypothetical protein
MDLAMSRGSCGDGFLSILIEPARQMLHIEKILRSLKPRRVASARASRVSHDEDSGALCEITTRRGVVEHE